MIRIDDVEIFVHTADLGSFSAAARQLDIEPALASSAVQRLERALGVRLFIRSTRRMRLSEQGESYLPHGRAILEAVAGGSRVLANTGDDIAGTLKLSAPSDLGRNQLLGWLENFQRQHPKLSIHLRIGDRAADFFSESVDAAIRYGMLADSGLVALPLLPNNRRTVCAAPSYLKRNGVPKTPDELRKHNCLRYVMDEQTHDRWAFHFPGGVKTIPVSGDWISDDAEVVRRWAVDGLGIAYKSRLDMWADIQAGRLVELFPLEECEPVPLQLVCAHRSQLTPAIQALRDVLVKCIQQAIAPIPNKAQRS
jgi:DNA-binding transcriptional LysR family regulator